MAGDGKAGGGAKRSLGKKAAQPKAPTKQTAAGEDTTKKTPAAKKSAAKKTSAKSTAKQTTGKQTTGKGTSAKQPAAKRTGTKKAAAKQPGATQTTGKQTTAKKTQAAKAGALVVRTDESPWSAAELAEVSQDLADEASRLRTEIDAATEDLADLLRDGGEGAGDDQADAGSAAFEREHELSLTRNAQEMLEQIEHAQQRIEDGTYGVCEGCGNPIGKARLLAFPRATLCVSCKQLEERR